MATGFTAPSVLFVGALQTPERHLFHAYDTVLKAKYDTLILPASGSMGYAITWQSAGGDPKAIAASDVTLYGSVIGTYLAGGDLDKLDVRVEGRKVRLPKTPEKAAARILWTQLVQRFKVNAERPYWSEMVTDLHDRQGFHEAKIIERILDQRIVIGGLRYTAGDVWAHVARHLDNPTALIQMNPPDRKSEHEKFEDTGGTLTWDEPEYDPFDPETGTAELLDMAKGKKALVVIRENRSPGDASGDSPVYARHVGPDEYMYVHSNRPKELLKITGGPVVKLRQVPPTEPYPAPILPRDYVITHKTKLQIVPVPAAQAQHYKDMWMHRLRSNPGGSNFLVLLDGHIAGTGGYSLDPVIRKFENAKDMGILIRFHPGAPHNDYRLGRLIAKIALQERTILSVLSPTELLWYSTIDDAITVNFTQHPEAKVMRGLMKLEAKVKDRDGYKLTYRAPIENQTPKAVLTWWLQKEDQWQRSR